jgi:CubicO group peptidase (beta-lactamase class C family)
VKERIFQPLGMSASNTSVRELTGARDVATPHELRDGRLSAIPWRNIDNIGPAGAINSNVDDMTKWLRFLLDGGKVGDRQLVAAATSREIASPQTVIPSPDDTLSPSTHFHAYGLGVGMYDLLGVKVMSHTGGIDGMLSQVTWVPERHLGFVILTNTEGHNAVYGAVGRKILDLYLGAPPRDWSAIMLAETRTQEAAQKAEQDRLEASRPKDSKPTVSIDRLAGQYTNEMYGDVTIQVTGEKPVLQFGPSLTGDLEPWTGDSYKVVWRDQREGTGLVQFIITPIGTVAALRLYQSFTPAGLRSPDVDEFRRVTPAMSTVGAR